MALSSTVQLTMWNFCPPAAPVRIQLCAFLYRSGLETPMKMGMSRPYVSNPAGGEKLVCCV
eukprot:219982-Prymnesium_polylepis.1